MAKLISLENENNVYEYASKIIIDAIKNFTPTPQKPYLVLGLPTGSTPIGVYQKIIEAYKNKEISFDNVVTFNMDEYIGLDDNHLQSYHYFMYDNFFKHIDIDLSRVHILNGMAQNLEKECNDYEEKIKSFGGIDIQLGGIGQNAHIAFNEPGTSFDSLTHVQDLTQNTIDANSRFFDDISEVPTKALTIGLKTIYNAKMVLILALGNKKADAIHKATNNPASTDCPASILQTHPNAYFICDKEAC